MIYTLDKFNGLTIDITSVPEDVSEFENNLGEIITFAELKKINIVWLTLPIEKSNLIKSATSFGFVFHNCLQSELTLIRKSPTTKFIPFIPTHTLGAGAIVLNNRHEILVVKEHGQYSYKLPGGHVELGESIESAIQREVFEETGVETTFVSIVGFATKHPFQFGKSNVYFICRLKPISDVISIQDIDEIADARWISVSEYVNDIKNSIFNKHIIDLLIDSIGLTIFNFEGNDGPHKKQEIFFSRFKE